jgi:predicted glycoside hydrolase/deacetylase ChbG (UPF0249 family)
MSASVVFCADDFGMNTAVSQGIAELARLGRLNATSVMSRAPGWPADAALLTPLRGRIDVGLHLDWTSPFAIAAGHGHALPRLMLLALGRQLNPAKVRAEIERQLDLFEAHWKAPPDHVDGHQHIQQFPVIREALVEVLAQRYPAGQRPWLRISRPLASAGDLKAWVIGAMGAKALQTLAQQAGMPCSQWLTGIYGFDGDAARYAQRLDQWLREAKGHTGVVLMCHPGLAGDSAADDADDTIATARAQELQVLQGGLLPQLLRQHGLSSGCGGNNRPATPDTPTITS